jgi:hypothetical protein
MTVDQDKFEEITPEFYQSDEHGDNEPVDEQLDELSQQFVDNLLTRSWTFSKFL